MPHACNDGWEALWNYPGFTRISVSSVKTVNWAYLSSSITLVSHGYRYPWYPSLLGPWSKIIRHTFGPTDITDEIEFCVRWVGGDSNKVWTYYNVLCGPTIMYLKYPWSIRHTRTDGYGYPSLNVPHLLRHHGYPTPWSPWIRVTRHCAWSSVWSGFFSLFRFCSSQTPTSLTFKF